MRVFPHEVWDNILYEMTIHYYGNNNHIHGSSSGGSECANTIALVSISGSNLKGCGIGAHQTRGIHSMLFQCWASVEDDGPALKQH